MVSKTSVFCCVAFAVVCCAAGLDFNGTCSSLLTEVDCCNETITSECGWCKEGETQGCYNQTEKNCTSENTCKTAVRCDELNLVDCCAVESCGWCGNKTTNVSSCSPVTNGTCPLDAVNECPTESTCGEATESNQCCSLGCGWCGKDGNYNCHLLTNASCIDPGYENLCPNESSCNTTLNSTHCCELGCGWCGKDGKTECHALFDDTCKAVDANQCPAGNATDTCTEAKDEATCCAKTGCGWCGMGCYNETDVNCTTTTNQCTTSMCEKLDNTTASCCAAEGCALCGKDSFSCLNKTSTGCTGEGIVDFCKAGCESRNTSAECCAISTTCGWCGVTDQKCHNLSSTECTTEGAKNLCTTTTSSTATAPVISTTPAAATTTAAPGQHFDAASFIGGIALTVGIFGIAVFGYKYYSAKKDGNYHTL